MTVPLHVMMARRATEARMPSTATIMRRSETGDGRGGRTFTYTSTGTTSKCRVVHKTSMEADGAGKTVILNSANIYFPLGTDVRMTDRIVVDSSTYEVQGLSTGQSFSAQLTATCSEIR